MEGSYGYRNKSTNQTRNIQDGGSTSRSEGNRKQMGFSYQTRSQWENCETQGKARCERIFSNSRNRFCGDFCTGNEVGNLQATHGTRNKTWFNNSCGRCCGAYLNGTLQETIYMEQPPDYDDGTGRVSLLIKALYGLKQAGRTWNDELNQSFIGTEYTRLFSDQCVYIRHQEHDLTLAAVHTDDITILGSDIDAIKIIKK